MKRTKSSIPGTYDVGSSDYTVRFFSYDSTKNPQLRYKDDVKFNLEKWRKIYQTLSIDSRNHLVVFNNYFDTELLAELKETFGLHSLVLEDIVNTHQRCKYESYDKYDLCISSCYENGEKIQISLVIIDNIILLFNPMKEMGKTISEITSRILLKQGRICERDTGYTAYAILDSITDTYFEKLEEFEKEQEILDEQVETGDTSDISRKIFDLKRRVLEFKKTTWPLREMSNSILRDEKSLLLRDSRNALYFRDLQDHIMRVTESADALRDSVYSLVELHMNTVSMRMNEVMKVLTIITTVFTPIMFIASIYGMNFDWIPEIHMKYGYIIFWILIIVISGIQVYFFKKKRWL